MKTFKEFLTEARMAPLYHATGFNAAYNIIKENSISPRTPHIYTPNNKSAGQEIYGVSLTRDFKFAKGWGSFIFEFDQQKLSHRHKFIPIDYWFSNGLKRSTEFQPRRKKDSAEAEEFILGEINNLNKYVTKIHLGKIAKRELESNEPYEGLVKSLEIIKNDWKIPVEFFG